MGHAFKFSFRENVLMGTDYYWGVILAISSRLSCLILRFWPRAKVLACGGSILTRSKPGETSERPGEMGLVREARRKGNFGEGSICA